MKNLTFLISVFLLLSFVPVYGQVAINTDASQANSHAMLDVKSNDKGMLIPRMTTAQRTTLGQNLTTLEKGMLVFDTETNSLFFWNSTVWTEMSAQNYWKTNGNMVSTTDTNFIGTINNMPLNIFTDSLLHVRITTRGQIEIMNTGGSVFLGQGAGANDNLTDNNNIYVGDSAGYAGQSWPTNNIAIGKNAMRDNNGSSRNIAIGNNALTSNSISSNNIAIGYEAFKNLNSGHAWQYNIAIGNQTLYSFNPNYGASPEVVNTAVGTRSMYSQTGEGNNTALGYHTLYSNKTGGGNIAIGAGAINADTLSSSNIAIGNSAIGSGNHTYSNIAIGHEAMFNGSGNNNIAMGYEALYNSNEYDNLAIGETSLFATADGLYNIGIGKSTLNNNVHGNSNTALGYEAGLSCLGSGNVFVGFQAGKNETGSNKLYIDNSLTNFPLIGGDFFLRTVDISGSLTVNAAIETNSTVKIGGGSPGINKVLISDAVGLASWHTLELNDMADAGSDASSLFLGNNAGAADDGANDNTAVGISALTSNVSGTSNTALGFQSGNQSTGNGNIFLGHQAGYNETGNDKLYIANTNTTTPLIGGDFSTAEVDINGTLKITGGSPGANKVLTSDASGLASWQTTQGAQAINDLSDAKTTIGSSVFLGTGSGASITTGTGNSALGVEALNAVSGGSQNTAQGYRALYHNTSGSHNTAIGFNAFNTGTSGSNNTVVGYYAGFLSTGSDNVFLGYQAGYNEAGSNKLYIANSDTANPLIGGDFTAGQVDINGTIKITGGSPSSGKILSSDANGLASWVDGATVNGGGWTISGSYLYNTTKNIGVGTVTPGASLEVDGSFKYVTGSEANGKVLTSDANGLASWQTPSTGATQLNDLSDATSNGSITLFLGTGAGASNGSTAYFNTATGLNALNANSSGSFNTAYGYESLKNNTAGSNTAIGYNTLNANTTGTANFAGGSSALEANLGGDNNTAVGTAAVAANTSGHDNAGIGYQSLTTNQTGYSNTAMGSGSLKNSTANNNVAIGFEALNTVSSGANNTAIGTNAGHNATGSGNIFIGYNAGFSETGSNKLHIDNTSSSTPLLGGDFSTREIDINGTLKITGGTPGNGKILTSDVNGLASWQTAPTPGATDINGLSDGIYDGSSVFLGYNAGISDDGANQNTAVGKSALYVNNSGSQNSAFGFSAMVSNTSGQENSAFGTFALGSNQTGKGNATFGTGALSGLSSGDYNLALGYGAGAYLSNGTDPFSNGIHDIFIGYMTKSLNDADTNQIVIGNNLTGLGNNSVIIGNSDITKTALYGKVGIGTTDPKSSLQVNGGVQVANDSDAASADKAGTFRYRADANNSYVEMCVQTGASTYAWVVIHQETW